MAQISGALSGAHTGHVWKIRGHGPKIKGHPRKLRLTLSGIRGHRFEFGGPSDCSPEVDVVIWVIRLHCSTGSLPTIFSIGSGLLKSFCPKRSNQQISSKQRWGVQEEDSAAKLTFPWDSCLPAHLPDWIACVLQRWVQDCV